MGGFDKYVIMEELKAKGWEQVKNESGYRLRPPVRLVEYFARRPDFQVYDARELQELLCEPVSANAKDGEG